MPRYITDKTPPTYTYCTEGPCGHVYERDCGIACRHTPEYWAARQAEHGTPEQAPPTTTPPLGLPATVDYHHLITLVTNLLPTFDPTRVSAMRIDHRAITVWYWDGQRVATHKMPITHVQGSATEGGHPTTPPTGLTDLDGSDTQ